MDASWKKGFLDRLGQAQQQWLREFDAAMEQYVLPAYDELREFLSNNGFRVSKPLREEGRRSFKFELAENAYVLVLFRAAGVNEFEIRAESFVPGREPVLNKAMARVKDLSMPWAQEQFQTALDNFVGLLSGEELVPDAAELVAA
jgi:hypothetical protein